MRRAVPSAAVRLRRDPLRAAITACLSIAACSCGGTYAPSVAPATPAPTAASLSVAPRAENPTASTVSAATTAPPTVPQAATPTALPTTAAPAGHSFTILVTGDLLSHTAVVDQARVYAAGDGYDFTPMLRAVQPIVTAADVAICHLETPVAPPGTPADGSYPDYGVPAQITVALATAGFDRCSLASNHAMDKGTAGVDATLDALDAAGLGHAGMARTPPEAGPTLFDVHGTTIAHLSYTFGFNGRRLPRDQPWRSNRIDPSRIVAEARQARLDGARFVLVSLHWGTEGSSEVTQNQRRWAEEITASGAVDVIVGHHAHVVQPIEQVNGRWVVFGLGNFLTRDGPVESLLRDPQPRRDDGATASHRAVRRAVHRRETRRDRDLRRPFQLQRPTGAARDDRPRRRPGRSVPTRWPTRSAAPRPSSAATSSRADHHPLPGDGAAGDLGSPLVRSWTVRCSTIDVGSAGSAGDVGAQQSSEERGWRIRWPGPPGSMRSHRRCPDQLAKR